MPNDPLTIEDVGGQDQTRLLKLSGPLTISNLFDFQNRVRSNTVERLILDLTNVPYVDSAGIGAMVGAHVTHSKNGRSLALVGVNQRVRAALGVTRVEQFFKFYNSLEEARATKA